MPRFYILTPYLIPGDAVSNDVFGMLRWLRLHNFRADAYAQYIDCSLHSQARSIAAFQPHLHDREGVVIYHHSVGWELGQTVFESSRNRKVLRYHSVTPARFFRPYHARYAADCLKGECQARALVRCRPECVLADSPFNVRELTAAGADPDACRVVPPFHTALASPVASALGERGAPGALGALTQPHSPALEACELEEELEGQTNFLFVGRVVPNKGHLHLIRAFGYYHHYFDDRSRLFIVGRLDPQLHAYLADLRWEVARHDLEAAVCFTGLVTPCQLQSYYSRASVFLCTSEHEGFCVPLVEAMVNRVPIVAYGSSAVRDTLGDTGLVWDTPDPAVLAESAHVLQTQPAVRESVVQAQWERYCDRFSPDAIGAAFGEALADLLSPVDAYA
jgi:glycosyltransferase involved in cell wall biosynthesis